ncbi:MAG: ATPase, T2SS/T4P/T4SS family [Pseudobdellovibrionaceae bacterium]|jgi:general secretion pathway protein E/type IV pilus assembly protein PilB|nr:ATPase, T2SS/T4P/T4SS family [Pseudobdellovibrionaceae bacterium]
MEVIDLTGKNESDSEKSSGVNLPARPDQIPRGPQKGVVRGGGTGMANRSGGVAGSYQGDFSAGAGEADGRGRIGERLVAQGVITQEQLNVALQEKKITGKLLGQVLVDLGFIEEQFLIQFLAESSGHEVFDPKSTIFDGEALSLIDKGDAKKFRVLPISIQDNVVVVAMIDPYDIVATDGLKRILPKGTEIRCMVTTPTILSDAIDAAYGYSSLIEDILKELDDTKANSDDVAKLNEDKAYSHPIVRLVNALLIDAVKTGVSDLHFEPEENFVRLRYRLDGVLFTAQILHKKIWNGVSQRLKIMSKMNIADKLAPQDGRFNLNIGDREADFRVSSLPTVHGENIVLRVLDKSASIKPLEKLGFSEENLRRIRSAQARPEGIIIVTGPTGSGKSTSLYSMINEINKVEVNIQTLEDPVEYSLPMIRQTHVREGILTFADGIKALLRQDPDIIFIGEIRDGMTGEMALKAAMTGHQVYTTLHTNDSFGAIPRLVDLGMKPGMIAGAIIGVFAQRLVRKLCESCKMEHVPNEEECKILGADPSSPPKVFKPRQGGCPACSGQGYKGRLAIAEILLMDEDIDEVIARSGTKAEMKRVAQQKGFKSMRDDGILKILDGVTSLEEVAGAVHVY